MTDIRLLTLLLLFNPFNALAVADDGWPQFRGPGGQGTLSNASRR